jgi:CTP:molybdopterin cytidylyltransferase MocA
VNGPEGPGPGGLAPGVTLPRHTDAVGLVLGAGAATRFGAPKQLAPFRGQPLIQWPVLALRAAGLEWVLAILGNEHERIAAAVQGAHPVLAPDWRKGLSASLRAGTRAAERLGAARVVVVLADQPLLSGAAVSRVLAASRGGYPIARADYGDGVTGHPIALSAETFLAVAELTGDAGARQLADRFGLVDVPCVGLGSPADADTPAELERLSAGGGT